MALEINYNPIYNEVFPDVRAEINERAKIYGSNTRGIRGTMFDWETTKQSWCEVYHIDRKNNNKEKLVLGFGKDKNRFIDMFDQKYGVPNEPILEEVRISNQGKYGSLQVADIRFRCFTIDQLEKFEKQIIIPGSDIKIKYGWSTGRMSSRAQTNKIHPKNIDPSQDVYRGITYNFSVQMENSLEWVVTLKTVGEGFFLSGISANAASKVVDRVDINNHPYLFGGDDNDSPLYYIKSLEEKLNFDVQRKQRGKVSGKSGISSPNITDGHFQSANDSSTNDDAILRYAVKTLPLISTPKDELKYVISYKGMYFTKNSNSNPLNPNPPYSHEYAMNEAVKDTNIIYPNRLGDYTIIYTGLSDLLHYYNFAVADRSSRFGISNDKRVYLSANYHAWKNNTGYRLDEEEQSKFPYGVRSVSIYDPEMVSCVPHQILFNGGVNEGSTYNSANYAFDPENTTTAANHNGYFRIKETNNIRTQFQRSDQPDMCNLGEILISVDFIKETLHKVVSNNDIQDKSIFSFFQTIFDRIAYASGGLYKLAFVQEDVIDEKDKYYSWYNVVDMNYTFSHHRNITPMRFHTHDDTKPIVRDIRMDFKVPNALANALYVEGRYNMNDVTGESGAIVDYLYPELLDDPEVGAKIKNRQMKSLDLLRTAKNLVGRIGITDVYSDTLYSMLKEYRESPPKESSLYKNATYISQTIYPLNLNIVIDGISGFRFGNVVEVDALPSRYYEENGEARVVFIITKVHHRITPHDWETELETQCRGNMNVSIKER